VVREQDFQRMTRRRGDGLQEPPPATAAALLKCLGERVVEPFARTSGQTVVMESLVAELREPPTAAAAPVFHPLCQPFADSEYCQQSRESHLAEVQRTLDVHRHHCRHGLLCAVVPLVWLGRCLAIFKLACPDTTEQATFESYAELLEVLVDHFLATEHAALSGLTPPETPGTDALRSWTVPVAEIGKPPSGHPQVARAIEYIEGHLSDHELTVRRVTSELRMNYAYLAHMFAKHAGMRMSRYITALRIERAKMRLASTDWQIKRIAFECGYLNADWFSHVFHTITGTTPGDYRAAARNEAVSPGESTG
jgi:AraC-like DNA-binding protein